MRIKRNALLMALMAVGFTWALAQEPANPGNGPGFLQQNLTQADVLVYSQLREVAETRLRSLAHDCAESGLGAGFPLGVKSVQELVEGRIGFGFEVYTVSPQAILAGEPIDQSAVPTGQWRFIVLAGDRPVGFVDVARMDGHWTAVGIGGEKLSQELNAVVGQLSARGIRGFRFVRIYQATSDLLEVDEGSRGVRYLPLSSARIALKLAPQNTDLVLVQGPELMPSLQAAIRVGLGSR